ncbi:uncharacterized protein [Mytilus edulis]|uniref:uncharacterized protein n=1 Tax=Mytilus edulis TaxID=6550 RepID=UPI0039EF5058
MDGFKLYVSNTSTIQHDSYLCYEDGPGLPNITQTIPCYELGKYVIYYDDKGSTESNGRVDGPVVELCYVAINDNIAYDGHVGQVPSGSTDDGLANDGIETTCVKTTGPNVRFHVDLKEKSIVTGMYIILADGTTTDGYHTVYASNTSNTWTSGTVLYNGTHLPTDIYFDAVFRFLTYVPPVHSPVTELELCEIGIIGCPPSHYGPLCKTTCPKNCNGPCDLESGICILGCMNGWTDVKCDKECNNGLYGKDCLEECSANCWNTTCNHVTGKCIGGCKDGWRGFNCSQSMLFLFSKKQSI